MHSFLQDSSRRHGLAGALAAAACAFSLILPPPASAAQLLYEMAGTVDFSSVGTVSAGDPFVLSFSFDSSAFGTPCASLCTDASFAMDLKIGALSPVSLTATPKVRLTNSFVDKYELIGEGPPGNVISGGAFFSMTLEILDNTGTALASTAFTAPPENGSFSSGSLSLGNTGGEFLTGTVNSVTTVPEPLSLALLASGLFPLAVMGNRRNQNAKRRRSRCGR